MPVRKRFVFTKDFSNVSGGIVNKGTVIDIVGDNIFMESNTFGGQVIDPYMYESLHRFIEDEYRRPNYLKEVPVPYNKA